MGLDCRVSCFFALGLRLLTAARVLRCDAGDQWGRREVSRCFGELY